MSSSLLVTSLKAYCVHIVTSAGDISSELLVTLDAFVHMLSAGYTLFLEEATELFLF